MSDKKEEDFKPNFDDLVKPRRGWPPGDGYDLGPKPWARDAYDGQQDQNGQDQNGDKGGEQKDSDNKSRANDHYEETQRFGASRSAARNGYSRNEQDDRYGARGAGRSYDSGSRSYRGGQDRRQSYDDHDIDEHQERNRLQRYRRDSDYKIGRARSRSQTRGKRRGKRRGEGGQASDSDSEDGRSPITPSGNTALKKWGATLAGAAVGGALAHKSMKKAGHEDNFVPAAIGAFLGGLIGRESEKAFYKRKEHRQRAKEIAEESD